jgi:hypothetical protein
MVSALLQSFFISSDGLTDGLQRDFQLQAEHFPGGSFNLTLK